MSRRESVNRFGLTHPAWALITGRSGRLFAGFTVFARTLAVTLALVSGLLLAVPVAGAAELDKPAIEAIIRDYLIKNPEVLEEALNALQTKRAQEQAELQKKALTESKEALFNSSSDVVLGNPKGDITLVEFFDYNCGYCKRGLADIVRLIETDKNIRVVLKDYPVLGAGSLEAAAVAVALREQLTADAFFEFHKKLLGTRGQVGKDRALEVAREMGADVGKINAAIEGKNVRTTLTESLRLGDSLGISGTPSYVVGDEIVVGAVGYDTLVGKIESMRRCGQATC